MSNLKNKKLFLFDMDGTIYLGDILIEGTTELLEYIRNIGGRYMFLTNNSSKSVEKLIEKLADLKINSDREDFFTAINATIEYLNTKKYKKIYAFGTDMFKEELLKAGLNITAELSDDIDCLCLGNDTELTFKKLEDACALLNRGVDFIATNPDWTCPMDCGYVPDCGSFAEMLTRATCKKPHFIGKPEPDMALYAIEKSGFSKEEAVLIGDRLYTDIACGKNAGISTILVLSGEAKKEDIAKSDVKPEFVFQSVKEVLRELSVE